MWMTIDVQFGGRVYFVFKQVVIVYTREQIVPLH